jgi:hypothetical protein
MSLGLVFIHNINLRQAAMSGFALNLAPLELEVSLTFEHAHPMIDEFTLEDHTSCVRKLFFMRPRLPAQSRPSALISEHHLSCDSRIDLVRIRRSTT